MRQKVVFSSGLPSFASSLRHCKGLAALMGVAGSSRALPFSVLDDSNRSRYARAVCACDLSWNSDVKRLDGLRRAL